MKKSTLFASVCASVFVFLSTAAPAVLVNNGGGLVYDTVLDITWAQPNSLYDWDEATPWAAGLTLGGVSGWRLPYISVAAGAGPFSGTPVDCNTASEVDCRDNELGYMFYYNLSGTSGQSILTSGDPDLALFATLESNVYWSGTGVDLSNAWAFVFSDGNQFSTSWYGPHYTWVVHSGNVSVPVLPAVWLFVSGLAGLIGVARRKTT